MATLTLRSSDVGAPTLSGTNGTLCAVLDWALVQNGWAIEFTAANHRVYRPGTGNRFRLFVAHDSTISGDARLATIRGCESAAAAAAGSITDPFPTVAQVANASSTVLCSITAAATARDYVIVVSPTHVLVEINCGGSTTTNWDHFAFGDTHKTESADAWNTICWVGGVATATGTIGRALASVVAAYPINSNRIFWCRSIDGSIKSTHGIVHGPTGASSAVSLCAATGAAAMLGGYGNRIAREKMALNCNGSSTSTAGALALHRRGFIPNLWTPMHSGIGAVTSTDTFEDLTSGATFMLVPASSTVAVILELTDTWVAPSG